MSRAAFLKREVSERNTDIGPRLTWRKGLRVEVWRFEVWGLEFRVEGLEFGVWG